MKSLAVHFLSSGFEQKLNILEVSRLFLRVKHKRRVCGVT